MGYPLIYGCNVSFPLFAHPPKSLPFGHAGEKHSSVLFDSLCTCELSFLSLFIVFEILPE